MNYKRIFVKHKEAVKYCIYAVVLLVTGTVYFSAGQKKREYGNAVVITQADTENEECTDEVQAENDIYVYVCGDVLEPGVIKCAAGTRMYEAVQMAGGMAECADTASLNMAGILSDGDRIYIPCESEYISETDGTVSTSGLVNINRATENELMTLPGIGGSRAADIINYRNINGRFDRIEDIMKVSGIKESAFNKIKNYISV